MNEIIIFNLVGELYGVDINKVKGIIVYNQLKITPLFNEKPWILGVTNIRGEVIPVIDLRKRFNNTPTYTQETVMIIIFTKQKKFMGIVVDFILRIEDIKMDIKPTNILNNIDEKYLKGFIKTDKDEMVSLFDIDLLLDIKELS